MEDRENRHLADPQLLRDIASMIRVVLVESSFGVLGDELVDEGCDGFALRAPGSCGLEDDSAVGVACFEIFGFGVEFLHGSVLGGLVGGGRLEVD
jgi:hypothetical protein